MLQCANEIGMVFQNDITLMKYNLFFEAGGDKWCSGF